jgi:hypothetical protein
MIEWGKVLMLAKIVEKLTSEDRGDLSTLVIRSTRLTDLDEDLSERSLQPIRPLERPCEDLGCLRAARVRWSSERETVRPDLGVGRCLAPWLLG